MEPIFFIVLFLFLFLYIYVASTASVLYSNSCLKKKKDKKYSFFHMSLKASYVLHASTSSLLGMNELLPPLSCRT